MRISAASREPARLGEYAAYSDCETRRHRLADTIHRMLLLFDAIPQTLPPINITVQPPAGAIPDWLKTVISAGLGALFGVVTSILMEFVKPLLSKRQLKKEMRVHLIAEADDALQAIEACLRIFNAVENSERSREVAVTFAGLTLGEGFGEIYDHFFNERKILTYEIDHHMALRGLYRLRSKNFRRDIHRVIHATKRLSRDT
jgi:hypothetical protein